MKALWRRCRASLTADSLARQFALASAGLAAAVLLVGAIGLLWLGERLLIEREAKHSAAMAGTTIRGISSHIDELAKSSLLASALTDSSGRDAYLHPFLSSVHHVNAIPVAILFTDFIGTDLASNDYAGFDMADRDWLRTQLAKGSEGAKLAPGRHGPDLLAIKLIRLPRTSQPEGALLYRFSLASLLYSDKMVLEWRSAAAGLESPPAGPVSAALELPPPLNALGLRVSIKPSPVTHLFSVSQLWLVLALVLIVGLAVVVLGYRVALVLTRKLRQLESFAREVVQKGFIRERAKIGGADEVAGLARSINHMLDSLNAQHERLRDESERRSRLIGRYRMLIEGTNAVSWEATLPDGDYSYVSPQAERLFGFGASEWHQRGFWRSRVHDDDIDTVQRTRDEAIGGGLEYSCEYRLRNSGGDYLWVEEIGTAVGDGAGTQAALRGILLDITQRKAAESEIQRLASTSLYSRSSSKRRLGRLVSES
jgi:PAS domain S-box-containing protein